MHGSALWGNCWPTENSVYEIVFRYNGNARNKCILADCCELKRLPQVIDFLVNFFAKQARNVPPAKHVSLRRGGFQFNKFKWTQAQKSYDQISGLWENENGEEKKQLQSVQIFQLSKKICS